MTTTSITIETTTRITIETPTGSWLLKPDGCDLCAVDIGPHAHRLDEQGFVGTVVMDATELSRHLDAFGRAMVAF